MKEPYELRVIADALERWTEGPAVNAMKYAMTTLREIADEIDAANANLRQGQVQVEQEPIPSSPLPSTTVASSAPVASSLAPASESPEPPTNPPA